MLKGTAEGRFFESLFVSQAQRLGLYPVKNHLTAIHTGKKFEVVKSEMDFKLISPEGLVAYIDCKTFQGDHFTYSQINPDQVERALVYHYWNVPSGFVVYFRGPNQVEFFTGPEIDVRGPKSRFKAGEGKVLGNFERFDLKMIFKRGASVHGATPQLILR